MTASIVLFWISAFVVFYTFFGYGILLYILVKIKERRTAPAEYPVTEECPEVTLLICAYNEADILDAKMENCLSLRYPKDKLHLVWVTDGSTDNSDAILRSYPENLVLHLNSRSGKAQALNRAMKYVTTPYVVMTDANTMLNEDSIYLLIRKFDNPKVGCVAGEKKVMRVGNSAASSEGLYWKYESLLKDLDSRLNTAIGAAGELIAIRRELWEDIPAGTIGDDMFISMGVIRKGYIIAYCKEAYALESPSANIEEERKRRVRLGACGFQNVVTLRDFMNPFKYGITSFQYVSHRVLRWVLAPSCLILTLITNIIAVLHGAPVFYHCTLLLQMLFYLLALLGLLLDFKEQAGVLKVPFFFMFTNLSTFEGLVYLIRHKSGDVWEKARRA